MKKTLLALFICASSLHLWAQANTKNFWAGLGPAFTSFQDVKYSSVVFSGVGPDVSLGYTSTQTNHFSIDLSFRAAIEAPLDFDGFTTMINPVLSARYLFPINTGGATVFIGPEWDVLDYMQRIDENLDNNSFNFISASNLKLAAMHSRSIFHGKQLDMKVSLQLLAFMKERFSFATSYPKEVIENKEFTYTNNSLDGPGGLQYYNFEPLTDYVNFGIQLHYHFNERWGLQYKWNIQQSREYPDYRMTRGVNSLVATLKF